ncbi:MAG: shikimate kinase [Burkholderiaceae bacterium]
MTKHSDNLFLVGMMGAGKSAVGRQLAARLDRAFVDTDHEIQARTGVSVAVIFEVEGEAGFRRREEQVIDELSLREGLVIATGGGAVLSALTRSRLKQRGTTIYLHAKAHDLWVRLRNDRSRPLLDCADPKQRIEELLLERDPQYREVADLIVETGRPSVSRLVDALTLQVVGLIETAPPLPVDGPCSASLGRG